MTGECLRHGETVEFETKWFEYRYMFKDTVLSGTAWMRIDGGEDRRMALAMGGKYEPENNWRDLEDNSGRVLLSFLLYQQTDTDRRDYEVFTTRSYDAWLMVEDSVFAPTVPRRTNTCSSSRRGIISTARRKNWRQPSTTSLSRTRGRASQETPDNPVF